MQNHAPAGARSPNFTPAIRQELKVYGNGHGHHSEYRRPLATCLPTLGISPRPSQLAPTHQERYIRLIASWLITL